MPDKKYAADLKTKVALGALCGEKTVAELSEEFDVPPTLINAWAKRLNAAATYIFSGELDAETPMKRAHPRIGQLTEEERGFLLNAVEHKD